MKDPWDHGHDDSPSDDLFRGMDYGYYNKRLLEAAEPHLVHKAFGFRPRSEKWHKLILPRLFGTKIVAVDGNYEMTTYEWRGTYYLASERFVAGVGTGKVRFSKWT